MKNNKINIKEDFIERCGVCGSTDIGGGATAPDYCRKCGAIDAVSCWYRDKYSDQRIDDKYKEE